MHPIVSDRLADYVIRDISHVPSEVIVLNKLETVELNVSVKRDKTNSFIGLDWKKSVEFQDIDAYYT